jgi:hypothetical protein
MRARRICKLVFTLVVGQFCTPAARAADGVLEISQTCAVQTGCFPGDGPDFPVEITQPGSYRLTGDLVNANPSVHAIAIGAPGLDDVTLDLGGFTIRGANAVLRNPGQTTTYNCTNGSTGGGIAAAAANVAILNGRVRRTSSTAIFVFGDNARVERVQVDQACGNGIHLGPGAIVKSSQVRLTTGNGIDCSVGCRVVDSVARENAHTGIAAGNDSVVSQSVANSNSGDGIALGPGGLVVQSTASLNGISGIVLGPGGNAIGNVSNANVLFGVNGTTSSAYGENVLSGHGNTSFQVTGTACNLVNGTAVCPTHP